MDNDVPCKITTRNGRQVFEITYGVKTLNPMACGRLVADVDKPRKPHSTIKHVIAYILIKLNNFLDKNPTD